MTTAVPFAVAGCSSQADLIFKTRTCRSFLHHPGVKEPGSPDNGLNFVLGSPEAQRPSSRLLSLRPFASAEAEELARRKLGGFEVAPRREAAPVDPFREAVRRAERWRRRVHTAEQVEAAAAEEAEASAMVASTGSLEFGGQTPLFSGTAESGSFARARAPSALSDPFLDEDPSFIPFPEDPDDPRVRLPAHRIGDTPPEGGGNGGGGEASVAARYPPPRRRGNEARKALAARDSRAELPSSRSAPLLSIATRSVTLHSPAAVGRRPRPPRIFHQCTEVQANDPKAVEENGGAGPWCSGDWQCKCGLARAAAKIAAKFGPPGSGCPMARGGSGFGSGLGASVKGGRAAPARSRWSPSQGSVGPPPGLGTGGGDDQGAHTPHFPESPISKAGSDIFAAS
mmetsp:Transcript_17635/g.37431  ORF Transcript_17635/g.37431 Transcript_17635/m.37431 type:complete len:398 (+) Transcript_17635:65-1258(+)